MERAGAGFERAKRAVGVSGEGVGERSERRGGGAAGGPRIVAEGDVLRVFQI